MTRRSGKLRLKAFPALEDGLQRRELEELAQPEEDAQWFQSQPHQFLIGLYCKHMLPAILHKYEQLICSDQYSTGVD
jgi:hypothetical protein